MTSDIDILVELVTWNLRPTSTFFPHPCRREPSHALSWPLIAPSSFWPFATYCQQLGQRRQISGQLLDIVVLMEPSIFQGPRPWTPFINIGNGLDHAAGLLTSFCQMFWPHASCLRDSNLDNFEVFRRTLLYNISLFWGQVHQMHLYTLHDLFNKMVIANCVVEHYDALF